MPQLHSICQYLDSLLEPDKYQDSSLNGLQVEGTPLHTNIKKVAVAVDAGVSVIQAAIKEEADLLIVHHGLFWGEALRVTGILAHKIRILMKHGCSLYASHLPLDGNREVGNGYELARFVALDQLEGFFEYGGQPVGALGKCAQPRSLEFFIEKLSEISGAATPVVLPFGPDKIESVAVVTGSGSQAIPLCSDRNGAGIDLLISGEPKHEAYHTAKELGVNALFAGHYVTETFGVRALQPRLEQTFDIQTVFIDEPTGI